MVFAAVQAGLNAEKTDIVVGVQLYAKVGNAEVPVDVALKSYPYYHLTRGRRRHKVTKLWWFRQVYPFC